MPYDPYAQVSKAKDLAREGVEGYGEALKPQLMREIGNALGSLNSIGALRSGGANVALNDIGVNYASQIGAYAKQAAGEAVGHGLEAQQMTDAEAERRRQRKSGLLRAIGGVLGAGIGFLASGFNPVGAAAGGKIGMGAGASDANYTPADGGYG